MGYSMQSNRKTRDGARHPDRNAQFEFINATAESFLEHGWPVISVGTKKKELASLSLDRCDVHGEWNYLLAPRSSAS